MSNRRPSLAIPSHIARAFLPTETILLHIGPIDVFQLDRQSNLTKAEADPIALPLHIHNVANQLQTKRYARPDILVGLAAIIVGTKSMEMLKVEPFKVPDGVILEGQLLATDKQSFQHAADRTVVIEVGLERREDGLLVPMAVGKVNHLASVVVGLVDAKSRERWYVITFPGWWTMQQMLTTSHLYASGRLASKAPNILP